MKKEINGIEIKVNNDGVVVFMSDWTKAEELVKQGYLTRKFYRHLYGHVEYKIK